MRGPAMPKILVIDDEPQIRKFISISFSTQGYDVVEAGTAGEGIERAVDAAPDAIVLDLGLPDMDGQDLLQALRAFFKGPILVLSVRDSESQVVTALDNGANDYIVKPFGVRELIARVRAHFRAADATASRETFDDGHLVIDFEARRVSLDGDPIRLSPKEYSLLELLASHPGRLLTQQHLLGEIWGAGHKEDTHYLRIFVAKLRQKLGDDPAEPRYISTEAGIGYRFTGTRPGATQ
ncbi:MAG: response regulator transcription factor [Pseudomonadales bacterium]|nr:response regulator transcription factor [Pseudomonadales bacterium]